MKRIKLLDCTLRDGGYVNDWRFGHVNLVSIFERLVDAGVEIIEVGFLDERRPFDIDRSIMPDTEALEKIYGFLDRKHTMVVAMIDYGTCSIDNIQPCAESFLDGIRVIFKKHLMHQAMEFCGELKALGYKVFAQLVSITSYSDEELLKLVSLVNEVKPYAVSMVDTYGLMHPEDMRHYYKILDEYVTGGVKIGFHAHNNFQLAYANTLAFLEKETSRDVVVDGTLYGMGKSAGNAPVELLGMRLNEKYNKNYRIDSMLEAIQESIMDFYADSPWGYKMFFYLCSLNDVHPNYLTYFEEKKNLSVTKIDELLSQIEPEDKKLLYDQLVAEKIYCDYLGDKGSHADDLQRFKEEIGGEKLLLIGPGKNIRLQREKVEDFVKMEKPYIISVNYVPDVVMADCIFITNGKRYHDMTLNLKRKENNAIKTLATTNVECRCGHFDFVVDRASLLEEEERINDNSFFMLIKLLRKEDVKEIYCAGFDGYSDKEDNYCNPQMEYSFVKREAAYLNIHMKKRIAEFRETIEVHFITYSAYDAQEDINGAAI